MRLPLRIAILGLGALSGCAGQPAFRDRPGIAEARGFAYVDSSGLSVITLAADVEQPVSERWTLDAHGVVDRIAVQHAQIDPSDPGAGNQPTGHNHHNHADMVTGASALASGGGETTDVRVEGSLGARVDSAISDRPVRTGARVRVSSEPDYDSLSGVVRSEIELFDRNLTVAALVGFGRDTISPAEPPPGQRSKWPASNDRISAGISISQLLSPTVVLAAGLAGAWQGGTLASPYRRALVRTTLFPEVVPDLRLRATGFASLSIALRSDLALHVRQGIYADDWSVLAWIPEAALALDLSEAALIDVHYRMYRQTAAWFYKATYPAIEDVMSGDARLGPIREHAAGVSARWTAIGRPGGFGALTAEAGYDLSMLDYEILGAERVFAHILNAALILSY
jgi:hypothetical protein